MSQDQDQDGPVDAAPESVSAVAFEPTGGEEAWEAQKNSKGGPPVRGADAPLERIYDLTVPVTVEVGRTSLSVQDILQLATGSIVELDHPADAPVELLVHGKCVAKGEIVVVDDFYGVRITSVGEGAGD